MNKTLLLPLTLLLVYHVSCRPTGYKLAYPIVPGRVIGFEVCHADSSKQYWLIEMEEEYGDSLRYNNIQYVHAVKTNELLPECKQVGKRVLLEFEMSKSKVKTVNCTISVPEVYDLKTLKLFSQAVEP